MVQCMLGVVSSLVMDVLDGDEDVAEEQAELTEADLGDERCSTALPCRAADESSPFGSIRRSLGLEGRHRSAFERRDSARHDKLLSSE